MSEVFGSQGGFALPFDESAGLSAPTAFGTYRVLHQTGSGVLGPVFRAFDPRHDRLVAVKVFALDIPPEKVARLADALRRLASAPAIHPAIVPLIEVGLHGTRPFAVMEHQPGETLDVVLRRLAPATLAQAMPILSVLAEAIDAASLVGVGHGALHPRDVFVTGGPEAVRVTGFGIVQALEAVGLAAPLLRRPYVAPERSEGRWDLRADVFSLGVLAHELFTGRRPAGSGEQDGVFAMELTPQQRVQLRRVLAMALAERTDQRYSSAASLVGALETIARRAGPPTVAAPAPVVAPPVVPRPAEPAMSEPAAIGSSVPGLLPELPVGAVEPALETIPSGSAQAPPVPAIAVEAPPPDVPVELDPVAQSDVTAGVVDEAGPALVPSGVGPTPEVVRPARFRPWVRTAAIASAGLLIGSAGVYLLSRGRAASGDEPAAVASASRLETARPRAGAAEAPGSEAPPVPVEPAPDVSPADVRRAAAPLGRLVIRSDPSGAMVTVDGRVTGETPLTVRDLSLGTHDVQVARPGHVPESGRVTLGAQAPVRTLSFTLAPGLDAAGRATGAVDVESRPRGARVVVDGRFVGQTPLRVAELRPGDHRITLELGGYQSVTSRVTVNAGKSSMLRLTLQAVQ
jgi:serine/threonine-protein kinase